jgi:trans-aconitate methyltransferase
VQTLAVQPDDRLLELGCGPGVAVALVCDRLLNGTITAIDRSAKMIARAEQRNAEHVTTGKATFHRSSLESLPAEGEPFDKIFAVNVNHFWVRDPTRELAVLSHRLTPGGALYLFYEPPTPEKATELAHTLANVLKANGFTQETATAPTGKATSLCLKAHPA